jgi:hypothetical protein
MEQKEDSKQPSELSVEPADHKEDLSPIPTGELPDKLAEQVSYGPSGIRGLGSSPYVLGAAFLASLGGFSFGYDQGVISIINVMPQFHATYPRLAPNAPGSSFWTGFMTGMLELGAFLGCFVFPKLADTLSRKWALSVVAGVFIIGAIMQTAAPDFAVLVSGRTITGIGVGTMALGAPLYISEISPPQIRGSLLVLESISIVSGVVIAVRKPMGRMVTRDKWSSRGSVSNIRHRYTWSLTRSSCLSISSSLRSKTFTDHSTHLF